MNDRVPNYTRAIAANAAVALGAILSLCPAASRADRDVISANHQSKGDTIVKSSSDDWTWTGMQSVKVDDIADGTVFAGGVDSSGVIVFMGTGVKIFGFHATSITSNSIAHALGRMTILIDGAQKGQVDLTALPTETNGPLFEFSGLTSGNHVLEVKVTSGWGDVDYITVQNDITPDAGKDCRVSPKSASTKFLEVYGHAMADDTPVDIGSGFDLDSGQIWHIVPVGNNCYRISPKERPDEAITETTHIIYSPDQTAVNPCGLFKYTGAAAQQWQIVPYKDGYFKIVSAYDHRCMNVCGGSTSDGTPIIMWKWDNGDQGNDQWIFVQVGSTSIAQ